MKDKTFVENVFTVILHKLKFVKLQVDNNITFSSHQHV